MKYIVCQKSGEFLLKNVEKEGQSHLKLIDSDLLINNECLNFIDLQKCFNLELL